MVFFTADGKLQEQLNAVQKEITRLEYQNNELDQKYAGLLVEGARYSCQILREREREREGEGEREREFFCAVVGQE